MPVHLIAPEDLLAVLPDAVLHRVRRTAAERLDDAQWAAIEDELAAGGSIIVIGVQALARLRPLWLDVQTCSPSGLRAVPHGLLPIPPINWRATPCGAMSIRPAKVETYFGQDEMPRAELAPLAEALDADGAASAYPAVWVKHYASSLVARRFDGSNWFLFAFERPLEAASVDEWARLIGCLRDRAASTVSITRIRAHYACYRADERVLIFLRVANRSPQIAVVRLDLAVQMPDGTLADSASMRRCLNGNEEIEVQWEFLCGREPGLWRVNAELFFEDRFVYGQLREDTSTRIERAECGFISAPTDTTGFALPRIDGSGLSIGERDGFLAGVHYYPSSSWWDWSWRGFRPERAARDLDEMVRHGYSFARVWIDPEIDEATLRGFEAWLYQSGARGLASVVCIFTQWARRLVRPAGSGMVSFDFAGVATENVYSVQRTNVDEQRAYLAALAQRWAHLPNVVWNLSNEAFVVDPNPLQIDPNHFGDVQPTRGPLAGAAYFNRLADLMTETLRENGAMQPVLRGYGFPNGGDCYLQNREGAILLWHHYGSPDLAGPSLAFAAPGVLDKPLMLEEFGIPTFDDEERLERYEGIACWSAAMGAAAVCAYEWGVSWLAPELPYAATPLKEASLFSERGIGVMEGGTEPSSARRPTSKGLCPWTASFAYGSNVPCTPFAGSAAAALGAVARFCAGIGRPRGHEPILLVAPMEWDDFAPLRGYQRILEPTMAAVQALAEARIPFTVVQEDQLSSLAGSPPDVVFPASQPVGRETEFELARLALRGAVIHRGAPGAWVTDLAKHAMAIDCDEALWCVRRGTRDGQLYMLFAPAGATTVRLRQDGEDILVSVNRYALVETLRGGGFRVWMGRSGVPDRS